MARPRSDAGAPPVKSAARTVELLEYLARQRGRRSLGDIQSDLGYPKSSLYVLLQTLVAHGWCETDQTGSLYGLGVRALLAGTSYLDADEVVAAAGAVLDWLVQATSETVHLARLDGPDVVYLATRESPHYLRPFSRVGRRLPAHATSLGKALLAERGDDEVRRLLPHPLPALTERTLVTPEDLFPELARTRRRGYAVDREENTVGLRCFGVALRLRVPAIDAVSCSVPVARMTGGRPKEIVAALLTAREKLEATLGRRP
jgi:DNA-binding IclR family transcriptional regulator